MPTERTIEEEWYKMLTEVEPVPRHIDHFLGLLPSDPRCKLCAAPFKSWGGFLMHLFGRDHMIFQTQEHRELELKGKSESIGVYNLRVS